MTFRRAAARGFGKSGAVTSRALYLSPDPPHISNPTLAARRGAATALPWVIRSGMPWSLD
jgi:hypothetical protein